MKVEVHLTGVGGVLATLQSLSPEIVSARGGPVKSALRKGALVILAAEQQHLRAVMGHQADGQQIAATGLLLKSLIVTRGKRPTGSKGERYLVRVKKNVLYPNRKSKKGPVTARQNAARLEYGTSKQPAEPFIRPAFLANAQKAISAVETELVKAIARVVKKLAAQNKGK